MRHWLGAGEVDKAATIVCRAHTLYSGQGQIETIRRWLELFSDEQILSNVPLTLTAGWVASMTGDTRTGRLWGSAALSEQVDDSLMPDGTATQRAWQATLRAGVGPDGVTRMRKDAELAATLLVGSHPTWRAGTNTILGIARWLLGRRPGSADGVSARHRRGIDLQRDRRARGAGVPGSPSGRRGPLGRGAGPRRAGRAAPRRVRDGSDRPDAGRAGRRGCACSPIAARLRSRAKSRRLRQPSLTSAPPAAGLAKAWPSPRRPSIEETRRRSAPDRVGMATLRTWPEPASFSRE